MPETTIAQAQISTPRPKINTLLPGALVAAARRFAPVPGAHGVAASGAAPMPGAFLTAGVFAPKQGARSAALGPGALAAAARCLAPEPGTNAAVSSALALLQGADPSRPTASH